MSPLMILALGAFFVGTFLTTWWIRGQGFGELLNLVRGSRRHDA